MIYFPTDAARSFLKLNHLEVKRFSTDGCEGCKFFMVDSDRSFEKKKIILTDGFVRFSQRRAKDKFCN